MFIQVYKLICRQSGLAIGLTFQRVHQFLSDVDTSHTKEVESVLSSTVFENWQGCVLVLKTERVKLPQA